MSKNQAVCADTDGRIPGFKGLTFFLLDYVQNSPHVFICETNSGEKIMSEAKNLQKELLWDFPAAYKNKDNEAEAVNAFAEKYKVYLDNCKTEREFVNYAGSFLKDYGYVEFGSVAEELKKGTRKLKQGDKFFFVNRKKSLIMCTVGSRPINDGLRITVSHVDSPRLDLKPFPVSEDSGIAYLKTHYYGGIRKYQWVTIPLALHGVVVKPDGSSINVSVGEDPADPVLYITDLLPHLGQEQNERKLKDGIKGEELRAIAATIPFIDDEEEEIKEGVKLNLLRLLNEKYGFTEKDFLTAELSLVPAYNARDVGLDRSLVGSYGQDDRVCAFGAFMAELETEKPEFTTLTVFADKEEIGSYGPTGMSSDFMLNFIEDLTEVMGGNVNTVLRASNALSTDVDAAYDPVFAGVYDKQNSCQLNKGCVITKYTGARGKSGSNDASAELMALVTGIFDRNNVSWQIGELGAVDAGGGGTVALYIARFDINVVDLGVPILAMHSPFELAAKYDIYSLYRAVLAFYK